MLVLSKTFFSRFAGIKTHSVKIHDKIEKYTEDLEDLQNTDLTISPDTDLTPGKKVVLKFKDQETANKLKNEYGINVHPVTVKVKGQE